MGMAMSRSPCPTPACERNRNQARLYAELAEAVFDLTGSLRGDPSKRVDSPGGQRIRVWDPLDILALAKKELEER